MILIHIHSLALVMQRVREEAAPPYLKGRVERGEPLPVVEVVEEGAVLRQVVLGGMKEDTFRGLLELMVVGGRRYHHHP